MNSKLRDQQCLYSLPIPSAQSLCLTQIPPRPSASLLLPPILAVSMGSNSTHEFPAPVGGVPFPIDFAPSILFAILYGLMVPVVVFRMVHPRSRNGVLIGTTVFSIER